MEHCRGAQAPSRERSSSWLCCTGPCSSPLECLSPVFSGSPQPGWQQQQSGLGIAQGPCCSPGSTTQASSSVTSGFLRRSCRQEPPARCAAGHRAALGGRSPTGALGICLLVGRICFSHLVWVFDADPGSLVCPRSSSQEEENQRCGDGGALQLGAGLLWVSAAQIGRTSGSEYKIAALVPAARTQRGVSPDPI